jgi:hypothetical protein
MGATIRDNILFSHEYDEAFYNLVLDGVYPEDQSCLKTAHIRLPLYSLRTSSRPGAPPQRRFD